MTWIVTGGAGFIGAHVVHLMRERYEVVVFDDLSAGRVDRLPPDVPFVQGSVIRRHDLDRLFERHPAHGVIHLAACKTASESVRDPGIYRQTNVYGVEQLLAAMRSAGVHRLLFASSAAIYGDTGGRPVSESRSPRPVNPYGESKYAGERIIAEAGDPTLRSLMFRQFNVVGAGTHPYAGDAAASSLLPAVFRALTHGPDLVVHGTAYPTHDGSPVRDFIHVADVAAAYLRGVDYLSRGRRAPQRHRVVNLGSGQGTSVLDLVRIVGRVTGIDVPCRAGPPRPGDAAAVVAAVARAQRMHLGHRHSLEDAVVSAWTSWQTCAEPSLQ